MTRTPGELSRRRSIAAAASGFTSRATVVLYACIPPGQDQDETVVRLREYAAARDWDIIGEVIDHTATATPLGARPNWPLAKTYIENGQAHGLVTTSRTACADTTKSAPLTEWLRGRHAFLAEAMPTSTLATEAVR
ncbi:hypothetical protein [Streptomyces nogalater]|uniref:Resolvase/invertase-type recombinase catalytic domain-containing protein n=1 Tax=Streptomyces nogalater TaxID=38314 RepID=A0ABW0WCS6_STRNO